MMISMHHIKKFYGRFLALDSLDLDIPDGSLYGIVGPNGAGKTTALRILAGIIYPDEGSVSIGSVTAWESPDSYRSLIGYVPDVFGSYSALSVSEYMEFFAACNGFSGMEARKRCAQLLEYVELSDRADFQTEALSRGMKQRLSLARALISDPPVLIMDEPTSGLDPRTRYQFKQMVGELSDRGKTIILSSHILSDISELCTDVAIIDQGSKVMAGRLMDVMKKVNADNPIVISLNGRITQAVRLLRADNEIRSVTVKGSDIMVNLSGGAAAEAKLLRKLTDAGLPVRGFSRQQGSLESIFMQLTGHQEERVITSYDADSIADH